MTQGNVYAPVGGLQRVKRGLVGGLCSIEYVPIEWVRFIPDINPLYNTITKEVKLIAGHSWLTLPSIDRDRSLTEQQQSSDAGPYIESTVSAYLPYDSATNVVSLNVMRYFRYLVVVNLPGGLRKLLGTQSNPVRFSKEYNSGSSSSADGGSSLSFTWSSETGAFVYLAVPDPDLISPDPPAVLLGDGTGSALGAGSGSAISI